MGGPLIKVGASHGCEKQSAADIGAVAVLGKNIWGAWPLIIWEATTAKRNYYIEPISGVLLKI